MRNYYGRVDAVTEEEAKKRIFEKHNNKITLLKYYGTHKYAEFLCNICGYIWSTEAESVWRGSGCQKCYRIRQGDSFKLSYEDVKDYIETFNCELISKIYINSKSLLEIKFSCGHIRKMKFELFKRGCRCKECSQKRINLLQRLSYEEIQNKLIENDLIFISFPEGYANRSSIIQYECKLGHFNQIKLSCFLKNLSCKECTHIKQHESNRGSNANGWKGGISKFKTFMKNQLTDWKKESMKSCNYKCIITSKRFDDIHHLYSLNLIIQEAISNLGLILKVTVSEYSEKDYQSLADEVRELHKKYPLGVCLTKKVHKLFHKIYGIGDTTPEQFYEFQLKIKSGEISLEE